MLSSTRLALRGLTRISYHDWTVVSSVRHLHRSNVFLAAPHQSGSVQSLIFKVHPNEATKKMDEWVKACDGQSDNSAETMLEALLESVSSAHQSLEYKSGELYVSMLSRVMSTISTDFSRQIMADYLHQQTYSGLGYIYRYAVENDIGWLKDAAQERMKHSISSISQGHELVTAYTFLKLGILSKEAGPLLEAKTKELSPKLSTKNIIKVLHILALMKYRSVSLVGNLVYSLHQKPSLVATDRELSNLFFSASSLNVSSPRMLSCLEMLSSVLINGNVSVSTDNVVNMVLSMGKLRWNNGPLLTSLCNCIQEPSELSVSQFAKLMSTCSVIGVLPDKLKQVVVPQLKKATGDPLSVQHYLDIAWSLLLFGIQSEAICKDLLSDNRISALTKDVPRHTAEINYSKLLNLCTAARIEYGLDMPKALLSCSKMEPKVHLSQFHNELSEMLLQCLDCNAAHLERSVWYPTGNIIDFRYVYDMKKKRVVSPGTFAAPYDVKSDSKPQPTEDMKWVVVLGNMFHHYTLGLTNTNPLEGRRRLADKQLQQMGYHVIMIDETEYKAEPDQRKSRWLKEKISL